MQQLRDLAAIFRTQFIKEYGATKCQSLLDGFGPQEKSEKCGKLVQRTAAMLLELLHENNEVIN